MFLVSKKASDLNYFEIKRLIGIKCNQFDRFVKSSDDSLLSDSFTLDEANIKKNSK